MSHSFEGEIKDKGRLWHKENVGVLTHLAPFQLQVCGDYKVSSTLIPYFYSVHKIPKDVNVSFGLCQYLGHRVSTR